MRVLRVGGVVSPRTLAISYSVSDGGGRFEWDLVAFTAHLDAVFLLTRFGERLYRSLESSQNNTYVQYNIGEKPTVTLYTYINHQAGTPET